MTAQTSTLNIPTDVLQPIINAHVSAAIASALGGSDRLITEAVAFALQMKVDEAGKPSTYSYHTTTFLQWLVNTSIRDAATTAVKEVLAGDMERVKAQVKTAMKNQRSKLTASLIEGIAKATADATRFKVAVTVDGVQVQDR